MRAGTGVSTFRWTDWTLEDLVALKGSTRVSLVVPARNEAATVGEVVTRLRSALMETVALVDEIVVIDSDSTDATASIAAAAGADVFASSAIRPDLGSYPGKGEAMWKSLFVTSGDVIVFIDADLVEWDTHFVPGLLGPLLADESVELVKGFYERPGEDGPLDGGRVTELVARPVLALGWPALSGLVQPLAGEWAIRRSLFEQVSVPVGYAVEIAALIDTVTLRGPDAIAQVDLGTRGHRHQDLLDLGLMSTQLLAAVSRRLPGPTSTPASIETRLVSGETRLVSGETRLVSGETRPVSDEMRLASGEMRLASGEMRLTQWARGASGEIEPHHRGVLTTERPPARTVPPAQ